MRPPNDSGMELRMSLFEEGHPERTAAYRFSRQELADICAPIMDGPFAGSEGLEEIRTRKAIKSAFQKIAHMLAANLADFRDDRDGFNGQRRVEILHHHKVCQ